MKRIVFSGLPGTGKTTLAKAVGRRLHIPVFAKDWLEARSCAVKWFPPMQRNRWAQPVINC